MTCFGQVKSTRPLIFFPLTLSRASATLTTGTNPRQPAGLKRRKIKWGRPSPTELEREEESSRVPADEWEYLWFYAAGEQNSLCCVIMARANGYSKNSLQNQSFSENQYMPSFPLLSTAFQYERAWFPSGCKYGPVLWREYFLHRLEDD